MSSRERSNVVNIDTRDWCPEQVIRWAEGQLQKHNVARCSIVLEYDDEDDDEGIIFDHMWSKATRESLLYMLTWLWQKTMQRYFGSSLEQPNQWGDAS